MISLVVSRLGRRPCARCSQDATMSKYRLGAPSAAFQLFNRGYKCSPTHTEGGRQVVSIVTIKLVGTRVIAIASTSSAGPDRTHPQRIVITDLPRISARIRAQKHGRGMCASTPRVKCRAHRCVNLVGFSAELLVAPNAGAFSPCSSSSQSCRDPRKGRRDSGRNHTAACSIQEASVVVVAPRPCKHGNAALPDGDRARAGRGPMRCRADTA